MTKFIKSLLDKNYAYKISNGDIYFRVSKLKNYGQLKNININNPEISEFSRVEHASEKENSQDFALWKAFDENSYAFDCPEIGRGRPGWHLECSAMIKKHFGDTIDIHGGGEDLIFPHHENEIAQSEALNNKKLANYWLHNGMIMINNKKMSKSEKNYVTIRESLKKYSANAVRFFVLSAHYRQPLNYTEEALESAQNSIDKIIYILKNNIQENSEENSKEKVNYFTDKFNLALSNDLNTPQALACIFELLKEINNINNNNFELKNLSRKFLEILGFDFSEIYNLNNINNSSNSSSINLNKIFDFLLELRQEARNNKNFKLADSIRDIIQASGAELRDSKEKSQIIF